MSTFTTNHTESLLLNTIPRASQPASDVRRSSNGRKLHALLLELKPPLDSSTIRSTLDSLSEYEKIWESDASLSEDAEEKALKISIVGRVLIVLYAETLDLCLKEASKADAEAEWWGDVERSWQSVAWYLLETLPKRLERAIEITIRTLRSRNIPLKLSSFTPVSLRKLFPRTLRPSVLTTAFFPHLAQQPLTLFTSPLELTRQECRVRKEKLELLRDDRAESLGQLLAMRKHLDVSLKNGQDLNGIASRIRNHFAAETSKAATADIVTALHSLAFSEIPEHVAGYDSTFIALRRPSRLTRLWPRLALAPPVSLILFRLIYGSRQSIGETALNFVDTVKGFWFGYVIEPVKGILDTVRSGGDEGARIISSENVKADIESLERMAFDLSRDKLSYTSAQLEALSQQIRHGDLTPVLKIYEQDIKTPIRSAVAGSLVRSLLIQVQKAKVDLDQALAGIDKLLKSQELTFAFVGVAPSFAVVYLVVGYLRTLWAGGRGNSKFGGKKGRAGAWLAMRRIERLLNSRFHQEPQTREALVLPPLTSGLLLISVAHLRTYAEVCLPARSRLREGFLEDVVDLEDPDLSRNEKQRVVERMWRSWGLVLGWHNLAALHRP